MVDNRFDNLPNVDAGRIVKMEMDYSGACDEKIPIHKEAAKDPSKFHQAIDGLLQLEKQTRLVRDLLVLSHRKCVEFCCASTISGR